VARGVALAARLSLSELSAELGGQLDPDLDGHTIDRVVAPEDAASAHDLVAIGSRRAQAALSASAPAVIVCSPSLASPLPRGRRWRHEQPLWVLARVLARAAPPPVASRPLPHAALVHPEASLAADVRLEPGAVVLGKARIGSGCVLGANSVIYGGVVMGQRVVIGASSVIGRAGFGWVAGPGNCVERMPHLAGVEIEDDVEIGALCTVDAGVLTPTRIGQAAKLDAHVHVGHNGQIGARAFVAAQVGFAGSVRIGPGVRIGGQAGITDHAQVGEAASIAAKSGVVGDIPAGAVVAGFPAVARVRWLRAMAELLKRSARR